MVDDLEEHVYSILLGRRGWYEGYPSISEFKRNLRGRAPLAEEESRWGRGWILWNSNYTTQPLHQTITHLLHHIPAETRSGFLVQFWAVVKEEGRYHYLSAAHHRFYISYTCKGCCWYRNLCVDREYCVDMEEGAEEEPLGGVGRAYRNKHPESTPDLGLYYVSEFPLRDEAARCGFRGYLALPLFDQTQCYGVLEVLSCYTLIRDIIPGLNEGLQMAGWRSTHTHFSPFSCFILDTKRNTMADKYNRKPEKEITEILELCIKLVPGLSLAQVWIPCKECATKGTTVFCMERTSFITASDKRVNSFQNIDPYLFDYLQSSEYHNLQVFNCGSLYDVGISKDPLAHCARRARLSHCFAICMESVSNSNETYALQFLLQSKDASGDSSVHLLLRIIEMKLKRFEFLAREQIHVELDIQPVQFDGIDTLDVMNSHLENFSELNFIEYMETTDLCCLQASSVNNEGWVFGLPYKDVEMNKIAKFMKIIADGFWSGSWSWMVQFWAPKMVDNKCYLETSTQPYALGCLAKVLASFRKKCLKHDYFVDEEPKEEELGPPGRVFRNGHLEISANILLYSKKEFPMRNYAVNCGISQYFALPVFNGNNHKCVGVLELIGFRYLDLVKFRRALKSAELHSTHIDDFYTIYLRNGATNTIHLKRQALDEMWGAMEMITKIPQLHVANVWVPWRECVGTNTNLSCMGLALSSKTYYELIPTDQVHWIHVQPGKGIVGMVLASENKSCFCRNISEFSIADHPLSHYEMTGTGNICFVICFQSSYTGDILYVLQFFLYEGPETYKNLYSFLNFLMPVMNKKLPTFKVANGKELGQELVVDVIEFSEANTSISYDYDLDQPCVFPVKFKSVTYGQQEHQHIEEQQVQSHHQRRDKPCNFAGASSFKKTDKEKRKTGPHLSLDILRPHFGNKLGNVVKELGVGRSTIKRSCRDYGINRWPSNKKQARNQTLSEAESTRDLPSSNNAEDLNTSLQQIVPHANMKSSQHVVAEKEMENVMVKVKYGEDTIKFELCLSLGVSKLFQEVARRLNLKMSSFKLKYMDEDEEEILITCDDDLQLCAKSRIATNKACIQLFVPKQV